MLRAAVAAAVLRLPALAYLSVPFRGAKLK